MNASDRAQLAKLRAQLAAAASLYEATRDEVASEVRAMAEAQQDRFDNLPEGLQAGSTGAALEEAASRLEEIADELESIEPLPDLDWDVG